MNYPNKFGGQFLSSNFKFSVLVLTFIALVSCNLDREYNNLAHQDVSNIDGQTQLDVLGLLTRSEDIENNRINEILYTYAMTLKDVLKQPELSSIISEALHKDKNGFGVSLRELSKNDKRMTDVISNRLFQLFVSEDFKFIPKKFNELSGLEIINALSDEMVNKGYLYEPAIYTLQSENADGALDFRSDRIIIAIAEEVNDKDEVIAYYLDDDTPFLLSEENASKSTDQIIFVGPGDIPEDSENEGIITENEDFPNNTGVLSRSLINLKVTKHQIKNGYRYESSNNSEVNAWVLYFYTSDLVNFDVNTWDDFNPRDIHKTDINGSRIFVNNPNLDAFQIDENSFNNDISIFIGAWEYDWYASFKNIDNSCSPSPNNHDFQARMKFSNEWYFFDCEKANIWFPSQFTTKSFSNEKCFFELRRPD